MNPKLFVSLILVVHLMWVLILRSWARIKSS